jgi:glutathione S-transferase
MGIILYDLCGADRSIRFSPYCWRTRLALAHKGLDFDTAPVTFSEIKAIGGGGVTTTVPVVDYDGRLIRDSWDIAMFLEKERPGAPLFGGEAGVGLTEFVVQWGTTLTRALSPMLVKDIHDRIAPEDRAYFRESREKRAGGASLETLRARREAELPAFRERLRPLRGTLAWRPFIGGKAPVFADYAIFGVFQWARVVSPFPILADDDPVKAWFERCLDLFDGMGRKMPAAAG